MRTAVQLMVCLAAMALVGGCGEAAKCKVMQYGSQHMTYTGSSEAFNDACRQVLRDLSYKEQVGENSTRYPYYGEGGTSSKDNDRTLATAIYMKTKDAAGAEYKITTLTLGKHDPVVILESNSADQYKLVNAMNAEFHRKGIRVQQY